LKPLRLAFAGTPDFAAASLQAVLDSDHQVVAVLTQPDRAAGRGKKVQQSPVKVLAESQRIPVLQPENLKGEDIRQQLRDLNLDALVVVAYGLILPKTVLDMPTYGCFNIHASLLPRWRGAAPIQRAIQMGDAETGVTIMQMDVGLDTGDMLTILKTPITADDTAQSLHDRLSQLGCDALMQTLDDLQAERLNPVKQNDAEATYAEKLNKAEAEIDWSQPADTLVRLIQAFNPWPVAFTQYDGQPLRLWRAKMGQETVSEKPPGLVISVTKDGVEVATGKGSLILEQLQPAGKKAMAAYPFCRLTGPANVLVMPAAHSASISTKMLQELGGVTVIGPLLVGLRFGLQTIHAAKERRWVDFCSPERIHQEVSGIGASG